MTEQQILKKIDAWDEQDKIQAIVDFVEGLPVEQRTTQVLSELARAYNNLYWLDQTEENKNHLRKAIEVFKYLEDELSEEAAWNYRIGYSYFFLDDKANSRKHFEKHEELGGCNNAYEFLNWLNIAEKKGIPTYDVYTGGKGEVEYDLEIFIDLLKEKAPKMAEKLGNPATEVEISALEQRLGFELPESFKQLHRTFSGQKEDVPFFAVGEGQSFVGINEVEQVQEEVISYLKKHYGENWADLKLPEENFEDDYLVKNTLYTRKWIPILKGNDLICMDLDPVEEDGLAGQIIIISLAENIEDYYVGHIQFRMRAWIDYMNDSISSGRLSYDEEEDIMKFEGRDSGLPAYYDEEDRTALEKYIAKEFGEFNDVFHELESPDIHCDVYIIEPTPEANYYTLVTGGMGAYMMNVPADYPYTPHIELAINLPPTWNIRSEEEKDYWPIRWLKMLARLPINHNTYLGNGHTIPSNEAFEGTNFKGVILVAAQSNEKNEDGENLPAIVELPSERRVEFFYIQPLYQEEMDFKLDQGTDALFDKFIEQDVPYPPVVDVNRVNVCEGYAPAENPNLLDNVAWAFNDKIYESLQNFWMAVYDYNEDIDNNLDDYAPHSTIFNSKKVKVMYEAYIKDEKSLWKYEKLLNPDTFDGEPEDDGLYYAEIMAECEAYEDHFGAIELLQWIHNSLASKELGDHIFFEGFSIEGYEEDGTPVISLHLGS